MTANTRDETATGRGTTMKAIVQDAYGSSDVLEVRDIDKPEVGDGEVLVRVHAASIYVGDWMLMRGVPYVMRLASGPRKPKHRVPGADVAGTVEAVGKDVKRLQPGDAVFGWCTGAFSEYACAGEDRAWFSPYDRHGIRVRVRGGGPLPADAGQPHLRAGRGRRRFRHDRPPAPARPGEGPAAGQKALINGASGAWARSPCRSPSHSVSR